MVLKEIAVGWLILMLGLGLAGAEAKGAPGESILRPWEPLEGSGRVLHAGNKTILVEATGLPRQISLFDRSILATSLRMSWNDRVLTAKSDDGAWSVDSSGEHARYTSQGEARGKSGMIRFDLRTDAWFDGLIKLTVAARGLERGETGLLRFKIVLTDHLGRFLHRRGPVGSRNIDLKGTQFPLSFPFTPFVWIGNDESGLFWFCETTHGWENAARNGAIRVDREGSHVILELSVQVNAERDGTFSHQFGLMPTPVKILPSGWRSIRMFPAKAGNTYVLWPNRKELAAPYFGYPASTEPKRLQGMLEGYKKEGVTGIPYACPTWISTQSPEWKSHHDEWTGGPVDEGFGDEQSSEKFVSVCPASNSWKAFVKDRFGTFIRQFHLDGLYMDNAQVYAMRNCLSGSRDGDVDFPITEQREGYISIMRALRKNAFHTKAIVHASGGVNLPSFSVVDAWVSGEQYRGKVTDDYLDIASLTDFRVELNSVRWGIVSLFLPEFSADIAKQVAPTRKLMSILLLHDVSPWPQWANVQEINRALAMLDEFGIADAEFVPYYSERPLAAASGSDVYVSGYRKGPSTLFIVANLGHVDTKSKVCMNDKGDRAGPAVLSWPERQKVGVLGGCFDALVPAGAYLMFYRNREATEGPR